MTSPPSVLHLSAHGYFCEDSDKMLENPSQFRHTPVNLLQDNGGLGFDSPRLSLANNTSIFIGISGVSKSINWERQISYERKELALFMTNL